MRRSFAAGILVLAVVVAGACSSNIYTSAMAVRDLQVQSGLSHTQAECIVVAIRKQFAAAVNAKEKANKLSPLPADQLKLEVDGALATLKDPTTSERALSRASIARCAPGALR